MNKFDFNKTEYEYFLDECPFTDEEIKVFKLRRKGNSVCYMAQQLNLSERTIKRRVRSINNKIIKAL